MNMSPLATSINLYIMVLVALVPYLELQLVSARKDKSPNPFLQQSVHFIGLLHECPVCCINFTHGQLWDHSWHARSHFRLENTVSCGADKQRGHLNPLVQNPTFESVLW